MPKSKIIDAAGCLQSLQKYLEDITSQQKNDSNAIEQLNTENESLRKQLSDNEAKISVLQSESKKELDKSAAQYQKKENDWKDVLQKANDTIDSLQEKLGDHDALIEQLSNANQEVERLQNENDDLRSELNSKMYLFPYEEVIALCNEAVEKTVQCFMDCYQKNINEVKRKLNDEVLQKMRNSNDQEEDDLLMNEPLPEFFIRNKHIEVSQKVENHSNPVITNESNAANKEEIPDMIAAFDNGKTLQEALDDTREMMKLNTKDIVKAAIPIN